MADNRLQAEERGLMSMTASEILTGSCDRGLNASSGHAPSFYDAAHTVYERHSQCASVLSEISLTLCDDNFLSLIQSNVQMAFNSTKDSGESAVTKLAQNWGIGIEAAKWDSPSHNTKND